MPNVRSRAAQVPVARPTQAFGNRRSGGLVPRQRRSFDGVITSGADVQARPGARQTGRPDRGHGGTRRSALPTGHCVVMFWRRVLLVSRPPECFSAVEFLPNLSPWDQTHQEGFEGLGEL